MLCISINTERQRQRDRDTDRQTDRDTCTAVVKTPPTMPHRDVMKL